MQNVTNQPQAPDENERGYAPVPPSEYREWTDPQSGYQQHYQGWQQQYWRPQPGGMWAPGDVNPFERTSMGMKVGTAGLLCYLFGWVGGLVFFLLEQDNRFLRFHAAQSILFFGTMSILGWVSSFFPFALFGLGGVVGLVGFIGWIVLMVAAHRGRYYKLLLFGDVAEQLANRVSI